MPNSYVQRQQQTEQAKVKEVEGMRKDIDALVQLVQGLRTNLERIPTKIEQLVAGFASSIKTLSNNYDLRDSGKTTTGIVNNVLKSSRSMEAELSSSARAVFQDHTFTFLKNWIGGWHVLVLPSAWPRSPAAVRRNSAFVRALARACVCRPVF